MEQIRREKGLAPWRPHPPRTRDEPGMMEAKFNISRLLDIPINCVERFEKRTRL